MMSHNSLTNAHCLSVQEHKTQIHTQSQYHLHLPIQRTSLSWVGWKKRFTDNETAQLKADRCTSSILLHPSQQATTPIVTSLSPSHHQWKAVRSGQPARRGPRTSSIFSRIQPLSRRRERHLPGLIRHQVNIQGTRTPPKLLHLPHIFLDT